MTADLRLLALANRSLARVPPVSLDPEEIERFVQRREGLEKVPGDHWREPFRLLCADLEEKAALTPLGRIMANGQLVGLLRARCRAERLLARHREIAERPLVRPIIILGPMRSGSTRVQRLLACDRRLSWTRLFETLSPVPARSGNRGRIAAAAAVHSTLRLLNPVIHQIHPSGPLQPDEEFGFLSFSFHSGQFAVQWDVPRFLEAEGSRDLRPVVAELAALIRLNAWARGEKSPVPVLKCPAYSGMADALARAFQDARFIRLAREPATVVASSASLVFEQRRIHSEAPSRSAIGAEWLARTAEREAKLDKLFDGRGDLTAFPIGFDEMNRDWEGTMHRLYRFLEMPLEGAALARMRRYMGQARAHRGHRYRLQDFGLDEGEVDSAFAQARSEAGSAGSVIAAE